MSDESLFREVDEDVRQEQYKKLWDRFGNYVMAAAFLVVAGVAGVKGYQFWQVKQSQAAGDSYLAAIKQAADGKREDASAALTGISHSGFRQLAEFERAGLLAGTGKQLKRLRRSKHLRRTLRLIERCAMRRRSAPVIC
ncbi:MAG: tetratricopeptide repeat protein [Rhizobiales bacterium]|nr:tetratricopeptide repeat protein [Hyphomicrobiales bacterium]